MSSPSPDRVIQDPSRIAAVRGLGVLNSGVHAPLDELTRQAASAVGAPVSSISLLDGEHEFFVSVHGAPTGPGLLQVPVDRSICRFTVAGGDPLRIPDLRDDERFGAAVELNGLTIVAYLGVPLRLRSGAVAGSLCVIDGRPRDWSDAEQTVLAELADTAAGFLALRSQILHRVLHDPVTGLPGETLFTARCDTTRDGHDDGRSAMFRIEFTPGPEAGAPETVLRRAAESLAEVTGATDPIGRLADGAFAVFAHDLPDERSALRLAARMRSALSHADGSPGVTDTIQIGIALCDPPSESATELLHRAAHVIRGAASDGPIIEIVRRAA